MSEVTETHDKGSVEKPEPTVVSSRTLNLDNLLANEFGTTRNIGIQVFRQMDALPQIRETIQRGLSELVAAQSVIQSPYQIIGESLQNLFDYQKIIRESLVPIIDTRRILDELVKSVQPTLEAMRIFLAQDFSNALKPLGEYFKQEEETSEAFLYAGFCIAPSMSNVLTERIVALRRENKKNLIAQTIMRYYKNKSFARLKAMVVEWEANPLFAPRMHIIRQAVDAHLNGKYALSTPVLLMQAEGIVGDFVRHHNIPTKSFTNKRIFRDALDETTVDQMRLAVYQSVTKFVDDTLYANKKFETLPIRNREKINRHVILHGRQVNYCTERNSLRAFLLLDALSVLTIELESDRDTSTKRRTRKARKK